MYQRKIKRFGWVRSLPQLEDIYYKVSAPVTLPELVDLRQHCPIVYDQKNLGSCTGNAIAAAYEFDLIKQNKKDFTPSRLFIYYNERVMEGTVAQDAGAEIKDGFKTLNKQGVCSEKSWAYIISKFCEKPTKKAYVEAEQNKITLYSKIDNTNLFALQQTLAKGIPFVFGFTVYESFESNEVSKTGIVNMPVPNKEKVLGGHAVLCVGYDNKSKRFIIRNSWGKGWGQQGYFTMPYEYLINPNLCDDFWCINAV